MNRFFVDKTQIDNSKIKIIGKDIKHIKDVLRLRVSDKIEVVSEGKVHLCQIIDIRNDGIYAEILDIVNGRNEPPIDLVLFQGIAKGDKMDFIIQKSTEIGVKRIYPVITKRTVVKINSEKKRKNKLDRWRSISLEAAKQSKRDFIPEVNDIISFDEMVDILKKEEYIVVPYEKENISDIKQTLQKVEDRKVNVIIGPEGGFEEEEINSLKKIGGQTVTLGPRILRTETAGIVTMSLILYELGDLGVIR